MSEKFQQVIDMSNKTLDFHHGLLDQTSNPTNMSPEELRKILLSGAKSSQQLNLKKVYLDFHEKLIQDKNSFLAITEDLFDISLPNVTKMSELVNNQNADDFPLFGYVFSIKECIKVKGTKSTWGLKMNQKPVLTETPFPDYLSSLGAAFLCKANVPILLFAIESTNNIYGQTANPHDKSRSAGGSSGGDACLVAAKLVNAGIGSDIGGSLRVPALFCGVYSFMLTSSRIDSSVMSLPFENSNAFGECGDSQYSIKGCHGPITRNIEELDKLAEVFVGFYKHSITTPPVPWRKDLKPVKKVAVLKEFDNLFELTKTNRRAMREAENALRKQNIEIVEVDLSEDLIELLTHIYAVFLRDRPLMDVIEGKIKIGEKLPPAFDNFLFLGKMPRWMLRIIARFIKDFKQKCFLDGTFLADKYNQGYLMTKIASIRTKFMNQMKEKGASVVLSHGMLPAIRHGTAEKINFWLAYMVIWNGFGFCGGAIPITKVAEDEQIYETRFTGPFEDMVRETMKGSAGLPVGIQVLAPPYMDEEAMQVMKLIDSGLKNK